LRDEIKILLSKAVTRNYFSYKSLAGAQTSSPPSANQFYKLNQLNDLRRVPNLALGTLTEYRHQKLLRYSILWIVRRICDRDCGLKIDTNNFVAALQSRSRSANHESAGEASRNRLALCLFGSFNNLGPSEGVITFANLLLGINQGLSWSTTVIMEIDFGAKVSCVCNGIQRILGLPRTLDRSIDLRPSRQPVWTTACPVPDYVRHEDRAT
jgi:hypothetical protein